ncbi:MAG: hypothetical protein J5809_07295 [Selenomonadaceae bacterium]|nr:hypothetical protein [Selenomonadaceae bacterium]
MDSAKEISLYLDRLEEIDDGSKEAVLLIDEGGDEYSGELGLPANFMPEGASDGDYLTLEISTGETESDSRILSASLESIDDDGDAALIIDGVKVYLPANFLPEGDTFTLKISRDENKTNAALDEARQLLEELE